MNDLNSPILDAAVLVPIYREDGHESPLKIVLVRRTEGGTHGGQIAFPGGKCAPEDNSTLDTALRETHEEIGLTPDAVEILGELPAVDTVTTGFLIHPYLGRIKPPAEWRIEPREIAEVLVVNADDLTLPEAHGREMRTFPEWPHPVEIPFYRIGPHKLWGATYRILRPLLPKLTTVNSDW
ncbi:MAG: CoA pyrophosphatase [Candidatus Latescibacterota bacterium]|nr:MAG: CoA pyrophosphatase [Candidatus Latescibacterota bacterium]